MKKTNMNTTVTTNTFNFEGLKEIRDLKSVNNMENVVSRIETLEDGRISMRFYELPPLERNEEKMLEAKTNKTSLGDRVETLKSEVKLFSSDEKEVFYWDYKNNKWVTIPKKDRAILEKYCEDNDYEMGEFPIEDIIIEGKPKTDPETWATVKGYIGGVEPTYRLKKDGKHAIYVYQDGDDYVIAGYHLVFNGFGIKTEPYDRFINTYHGVYGGHDTWCHISEDECYAINWLLELPEPLLFSVYSKDCFEENCVKALGDNFEVIYVTGETENPEGVEELVLVEHAPEDCNSIMCEVEADIHCCGISGCFDENGFVHVVDGFKEPSGYIEDENGNYLEYRVPVFRVNIYEIDGVEYTAIEVDNHFKLWLYEHNGFIGNQYGYWYVPMDATKAVFDDLKSKRK